MMQDAWRRSTSRRDSAHWIDDAVAQSGRRALLAFGSAMAGRAQPSIAPHTFSPNDVGALSAYVLRPNDMLDDNSVAGRSGVPKVARPKRDGFVWRDPLSDTHARACMTDRTDPARGEIKSRAEGRERDAADRGSARRHANHVT
jgi:hypothetical protein